MKPALIIITAALLLVGCAETTVVQQAAEAPAMTMGKATEVLLHKFVYGFGALAMVALGIAAMNLPYLRGIVFANQDELAAFNTLLKEHLPARKKPTIAERLLELNGGKTRPQPKKVDVALLAQFSDLMRGYALAGAIKWSALFLAFAYGFANG